MYLIELPVYGMVCGYNELKVEDSLRNALQNKKVYANHQKNKVTIVSDKKVDIKIVKNIIKNQGYQTGNDAVTSLAKRSFFRYKKVEI